MCLSPEAEARKIAEHEKVAAANRDRQLKYLAVLESQKPDQSMYLNRDANKVKRAAEKAARDAGKPTCHACKSRKHRRRDEKIVA